MNDKKDIKTYAVKDNDGVCLKIEADNWTCGGNGLKFELDDVVVAWFMSWQWFMIYDANDKD